MKESIEMVKVKEKEEKHHSRLNERLFTLFLESDRKIFGSYASMLPRKSRTFPSVSE